METVRPYEGDLPYLFVSYAHADTPAVMEVLAELQARGYRLWYDEGIEVGSEWPENIADHLARAGAVLAFVSRAYTASENCRREMHFALTKKIETVNIFLEETRMTPGMEMQIGNRFALMKYSMRWEEFCEKLFAAPQLDPALYASAKARPVKRRRPRKAALTGSQAEKKRKKRKARRIVGLILLLVLLAAGITLGIIGWSTGLAQRLWIGARQEPIAELPASTVCAFREPLLEQAARQKAGKESGEVTVGDLAGVTSLCICGDTVLFAPPEEIPAEIGEGSVEDLSDLQYFSDLRTLVLIGQPLKDLETMPACGIEYLTLDCPELSSLQGIGRLTRLREVVSDGSPVTELGDLEQCLQLRRLSLRGAEVSDYTAVRPLTKLAEFSVSNAAINELRPVMRHSNLTDVAFYDCDLRGQFFKSFDREKRIVTLTMVNCKLNSTANLEDFTGLTTLRLIDTGTELDWTVLQELPALKTVYINGDRAEHVRDALAGTDVELVTVP